MRVEWSVTEAIEPKDEEAVFQGLLQYNLARLEDRESKDLGIFCRNDTGDVQAGLIGDTHGNWLTIKYLFVAEALRGQRLGSRLLQTAEETAKKRGCKYAFLDTFHFQAPGFYEKHGYQEVFALKEYPRTGSRYYYTKTL